MPMANQRDIQVTDLRKEVSAVLSQAGTNEVLHVLRRGREVGYFIKPEAFRELISTVDRLKERVEGLEETLAILSDKELMARLRKSIKQLKEGKYRSSHRSSLRATGLSGNLPHQIG
jgi:PHD/YefM family antitoxin component YafN of YafNO toxin-antitoxin module